MTVHIVLSKDDLQKIREKLIKKYGFSNAPIFALRLFFGVVRRVRQRIELYTDGIRLTCIEKPGEGGTPSEWDPASRGGTLL